MRESERKRGKLTDRDEVMKKWRNKRTTNRKKREKVGNMERERKNKERGNDSEGQKERICVCEREIEGKIRISERQRETEGMGKQENIDLGKVGKNE
ncbi:hypothetical protein Zmor_027444 [Zophobas morio]|uniref:Uncharacterized protein n=1 Tax=Zophobas morio TaxID=2755281 RepID=A0AA38M2J9_9CUCU|nr:hypothetical protein Zmor_027444 [Zophobas morio]